MVQTDKQTTGRIGENVACQFLEKRGFSIVERNYRKKWGEIDIVAQKDDVLHFVEVKATKSDVLTDGDGGYRPEENVRSWKMKRMSRAVRTYLAERQIDEDREFEVDVLAIRLDFEHKKAKIRMISNVLLT